MSPTTNSTHFLQLAHCVISFCAECLYARPQTGQARPLFRCW